MSRPNCLRWRVYRGAVGPCYRPRRLRHVRVLRKPQGYRQTGCSVTLTRLNDSKSMQRFIDDIEAKMLLPAQRRGEVVEPCPDGRTRWRR